MSKKKGEQFEESLKKLEGIVERLERGNLPLEEAMEAYTEGVRLIQHCHRKLEEAESKIQVFLKDQQDGGGVSLAPFDPALAKDPLE